MALEFQKNMDKLIAGLSGKTPSLLLHSCCAPCSSYVLEYLSQYFQITVFFYNPNIHPEEEYRKRLENQKKLLLSASYQNSVSLIEGKYDPERFFACVKGLEQLPEGAERCRKCFELRLRETAEKAKKRGFEYFATTLTVSPHKSAVVINEIGKEVGGQSYIESDFKKREGYKRSIILSKEYGLYRQNYCGCVFSKREVEL